VLSCLLLAACSQQSSTSPTPSLIGQEVEFTKAVKHYYEVFNQVRATNDWTLIESVSEKGGLDWSNVRAFALTQMEQKKISITTHEVFSNWKFDIKGNVAKVYFSYQASGYDADPQTHQPLEAEVTLKPDPTVIEFRRSGDVWLVFSRQRQ